MQSYVQQSDALRADLYRNNFTVSVVAFVSSAFSIVNEPQINETVFLFSYLI
jgi:hypothetical protein